MLSAWRFGLLLVTVLGYATTGLAAEPARLKLLFLGDRGHHRPADRFRQLQPVLAEQGIDLTYTEKVSDLNPATLGGYSGLVVYANIDALEPSQEKALLDYVAAGRGLVALHCASFCFRNSQAYIDLVGAQFQRHGTGTFRTEIVEREHPIMRGYEGFESWDETYVHTKHNEQDRTVLEYRVDDHGREPWTWTRRQGQGRVFYTAWGHDQRTWSNPGFQNLVQRGMRWAVGDDPGVVPAITEAPAMTPYAADARPLEYVPAKVAFYPPGGKRTGDGQWNKMQKPLEPAESLKHLSVPRGFRVELFVSEPALQGKPICMNWDERGRLWVAETVDYPNELQPAGQGHDRIRICEDTDGDQRADKFTVFADQLSIPTSLTFARGGVIVHQAPDTLFLRDTNGDDVADERRVLFSGWITSDTHSGPSNMRYGLDNWIWGAVGYSGFKGTVGGEEVAFNKGFYRFRPDGSKLEFLRSTNNNTWGLGFSEDGLVFGSTANGNPSEYLPIANRYYEMVRGWSPTVLSGIAGNPQMHVGTDKVRQVDWHGGFTAAAGHALYTARTYPREYWNRTAFVCESTGHIVASFVLQPNGSDFSSRTPYSLLQSDDEWCAPTMAEIGPDGCVWVIDWYNYIVQHNPTPVGFTNGKGNAYETDLRDKTHGRIYRIVPTQGTLSPPPTLDAHRPETLVAALRHDNMLWRLHAQRLLVERQAPETRAALLAMAGDRAVDEIQLNVGAIHALWALHGLPAGASHEAAEQEALRSAVAHPSPGVRRAAIQTFPRRADLTAGTALRDADAQVRLAAFLALADADASPAAAAAILSAIALPENARDRWIADAATAAAANCDRHFLAALAQWQPQQPVDPKVYELATRVAEHVARGAPADALGSLLVTLADGDPAHVNPVLEGLARGWPKKTPARLDEPAEAAIGRMLGPNAKFSRAHVLLLADRLGSVTAARQIDQLVAEWLGQVQDGARGDAERLAAARQLIEFRRGDEGLARKLLTLITPQVSPELASGLVEAVGRSEAAGVGTLLVERLETVTPAIRPTVIRALLARSDWTRALLDALASGRAQASDLSLDQKQALAAHPDKQLARRARELLARGGGLPDANRQRVIDTIGPQVLAGGDATRGKEVFKQQCAKCHVHGGEGNKIGPDLTGMAVHPKQELLVHLLDPSRSVEGNYRQYVVTTDDGRVFTGLLAAETKTSVELVDAEAKRHVLQREEIDEMVASRKSIMPEGFEKQVTAQQIADLLEFLTRRGRFTPLDLRPVATIVSTQGMFYAKEAGAERLIFSDWSTKTFQGVPFLLVDPQGDRVRNVVLLYSPNGQFPPQMPKSVSLPVRQPAQAIHLLSGVSGWGYAGGSPSKSVSMIVRIHYADGQAEDHPLADGVHFADYIRVVEVPESALAFKLRGQQVRYLVVRPARRDTIERIELVKGPDRTAPVVMAVTVEQ